MPRAVIKGPRSPRSLRFVAALLVAALLPCGGCKKKEDAAAAAAAAAAGPPVTSEVDPTSLGVPIYPGAARVKGGAASITLDGGSTVDQQMIYAVRAPLDRVVAFYREQLSKPTISEVRTGSGRSVTLLEQQSNESEVAARLVTVSEIGGRSEIAISSTVRDARFSVFLNSVPPDKVEEVVAAICDWKGRPEDTKAAQTQEEEARKILTVLPRPVDVGLPWDKATDLKDKLEALGGEVDILPKPEAGV